LGAAVADRTITARRRRLDPSRTIVELIARQNCLIEFLVRRS
jgi:hypothetical protein